MIADWLLLPYSTAWLRLVRDALPALAGAGMKRTRRQEPDVPADGCRHEWARIVIASNPDPGGRWGTRCTAARKDLDNDHAAAAARARRVMIGCGVRIGGVVRCWLIDLRYWGGHQLPGARDVGLAAGAGQQPIVADAMIALW